MRMCAWLDDLVFAMIRGGNALGGDDSSSMGGIGVGSTHSLSLRSVEADETLRDEKSTVCCRYM